MAQELKELVVMSEPVGGAIRTFAVDAENGDNYFFNSKQLTPVTLSAFGFLKQSTFEVYELSSLTNQNDVFDTIQCSIDIEIGATLNIYKPFADNGHLYAFCNFEDGKHLVDLNHGMSVRYEGFKGNNSINLIIPNQDDGENNFLLIDFKESFEKGEKSTFNLIDQSTLAIKNLELNDIPGKTIQHVALRGQKLIVAYQSEDNNVLQVVLFDVDTGSRKNIAAPSVQLGKKGALTGIQSFELEDNKIELVGFGFSSAFGKKGLNMSFVITINTLDGSITKETIHNLTAHSELKNSFSLTSSDLYTPQGFSSGTYGLDAANRDNGYVWLKIDGLSKYLHFSVSHDNIQFTLTEFSEKGKKIINESVTNSIDKLVGDKYFILYEVSSNLRASLYFMEVDPTGELVSEKQILKGMRLEAFFTSNIRAKGDSDLVFLLNNGMGRSGLYYLVTQTN